MSEEQKLTIKQQKFINEYIKDGNGARAAREAGYSEKTAYAIASENLSKPYIKKAIGEKMSDIAKELELDVKYVLSGFKEISENRYSENTGYRLKALELIGKYLKMFVDQQDITLRSHEEALRELE